MRMETIAEHLVDVDLLPEKANILDIGCRGFIFTDEMRRRGYNVFAIDIDHLERSDYFRLAITDRIGYKEVIRTNDPQATHTANAYFDRTLQGFITMNGNSMVYSLVLELFCDIINVPIFDVIKIDVEGDERGIIMGLNHAPAKQLSIEFHLHTGVYGELQVEEMVNKLVSIGYKIASHEKTSQHGMGFNYWSSLFIYDKN